MDKWYNVGKIVNTHGIKGEVRVVSTTDFPEERYQQGSRLFIIAPNSTAPIEVIVASHRVHKSFDLLTFEGYRNINDVEPFKGSTLKVSESQLGELEENEFYYHEIIGCTVTTLTGEELGKIHEILSPGANDVWVVKGSNGKDILIPYIEDVVKTVDIQEKRVIIDPLEGLLP